MNEIAQIEVQLEKALTLLESQKSMPGADRPSHKLTLISFEQHVEDLQGQLRDAKSKRSKEIVIMRITDFSSIPLSIAGSITRHTDEALHSIARFLGYGKGGGSIPRRLINMLDLRLEAIGRGSTKFYISGNLSPNLQGFSLLEEALKATFDLLNSEDDDTLLENVSTVGPHATSKIKHLMKDLKETHSGVELSWNSSSGKPIAWKANAERVRKLGDSLSAFADSEPTIERIDGLIHTLSLNGRVTIKSSSGATISASVPSDIVTDLKQFHLGEHVSASVQIHTTINDITNVQKTRHTLLDIKPFRDSES